MAVVEEELKDQLSGTALRRSLRRLVLYAFNIPPVFGVGLIVWIGVLQPRHVIDLVTGGPLWSAYILFWFVFALWLVHRGTQPLVDWLDDKPGCSAEGAQQAVRRFPMLFWATFLGYLAFAPAATIISAELYSDFVSTPLDWFRIQLVAIIVSIIVGLPIFFLMFDLFGQALGTMSLSRPIFTIRTKVFVIGALVPLLIDTMLVQYYWTRTGYFSLETFGVWILLEVLAIAGSLVFARSFGLSLRPLQVLAGATLPLPEARIAALRARSTDEIGVVTTDYRKLLAEQRQQWQILEHRNSLLRIAATAFESDVGMIVSDSKGLVLQVNRAFTKITGGSAEETVGRKALHLFNSSRYDAAFHQVLLESIQGTGRWQGEIWDRRKAGGEYPIWLTISAVKDDQDAVTHYVGALQDITERKQAEERIKELAFFDQLTGRPNRRLLIARLRRVITSGARSGKHGALLFIDLDNFKTLNDTLGHDIGDILLQQVAQRLVSCVREGDTVARLGGDEFVVMLEDLSKYAEEAADQTQIVGKKILATLDRPYQLANYTHHSTCSIGGTLFADHQGTTDDLLKQADLAMYQAKAAGRNALRFFDPEMQAVISTRAALEAGLRKAIQENQFSLYYQAQVNGEGYLTGAEGLLRWLHPQHGMVLPFDFIPLAEDTGLILQVGQWVLETACTQLAAWAALPDKAHLSISVNVSARQLHHTDFVATVLRILDRSGANPKRLKLELTESLLVDDVEGVITKMVALKARGVSFSLDDFGTGYSSLSYLKRLPLDQLKIDRSFVRDILTDTNDAAIARMVVALAENMGLSVIAEGVTTEAQKDFLADIGCSDYQGYLSSRPLPIAEFEELFLSAKLSTRLSARVGRMPSDGGSCIFPV